jgi:hypothetical protein
MSSSKPRRNTSQIILDTHTDLVIVAGRLDSRSVLHDHPRLAPSGFGRRGAPSRSTIPPTLLGLCTPSPTLALALLSVSGIR